MQDPRRTLGQVGEDIAAAHLERRDLRVIARNVRTRHGEIDLIAAGAGKVVFAEVKTRQLRAAHGGRGGGAQRCVEPLEAIGPSKRARLRRLTAAWLAQRPRELPAGSVEVRFDAIGVTLDAQGRLVRLDHVEGAW